MKIEVKKIGGWVYTRYYEQTRIPYFYTMGSSSELYTKDWWGKWEWEGLDYGQGWPEGAARLSERVRKATAREIEGARDLYLVR